MKMDRRDRRREKSANYTRNEKHLLLDSILPYLNDIENKKTDAMTVDIKVKSWNAVAAHYNNVNVKAQRRVSQLKTLYENIKKRTKKDILTYQTELKSGEGKTSLKRIDDVGWRLIKMVPALRILWKNTVLLKQQLARNKGDPLTLDNDNESLASVVPTLTTDNFDASVIIKDEFTSHNQQLLTVEEMSEINGLPNEAHESPNFHNYAIPTNESAEEATDNVDINFTGHDDFSAFMSTMEKELKKKELEKLDLDIQMKKLELEFMKGKLKEQEMSIKFRQLEYEIKCRELDKCISDRSNV